MKIYRNISTVKAKDAQGKKPTHYLKASVDQNDKAPEFVASLWAKEWKTDEGTTVKFLSGQMKEQWTDHTDPTKSRKGFVIVEEADLNRLLKLEREVNGVEEVQTADTTEAPF